MKPRRSVLAVGGGLFVLAAASILDMANVQSPVVSSRGDRLDVAERAARCGTSSLIAACANDPQSDLARAEARSASMMQLFEEPGKTIAVRIRLGD